MDFENKKDVIEEIKPTETISNKTFTDILNENSTNGVKKEEKKELDSNVINDNSITDDQYFDDFFQDE